MSKKLLYSFIGLALILVGGFWVYRLEAPTPNTPEVNPVEDAKPSTMSDSVPAEANKAPKKNIVSFADLLDKNYQTEDLKQGQVLEDAPLYTKYAVTYMSGELTISGVLYVPKGAAPAGGFPVLVTNHGYIEPAIYTTGRGLKREQGYFATRGYVVLHPDYRNHAGSTKSNADPIKMRLGYVADIIHAVLALEASSLPIDRGRVAMVGHSMGGGASLAAVVAKPDLVEKVVLYAPVSLNYQDSYERYMNDDLKRKEKVVSVYGTPEANPDFWKGLSGEPYLERLSIPVQIYHGTSDDDVPLAWSENTERLLKEGNKQSELITYPGEEHEFGPRWTDFMEGMKQFIEK
jgi:dipeptidyl aminopeptidase/acylaminoacyl peptidase